MKILHFTNRFWPALGGVEDVINNLCIELRKKGHISDVLTINKVDGRKLKAKDSKGKTKIFRIPFLDLKYYKISAIPFSLLKKYDIIHIHSLGFLSDMILLTKFIHKKKIIISTNGGIFHTKNISGLKSLYFYIIERLLLKNADKIIAISNNDKKKFDGITKNIVMIEPGFSAPEPKGKKEKTTFLTVGRLSQNKNIERLIDVFAGLKKDYKLEIVGRDFDNLLQTLKRKIKYNKLENKIKIITDADDLTLSKLYSKSEYFVSASKYEGFGIGGIEGMHYNCKAILNNIPTFKEFVKNGSGSIIKFDNKNASEELKNAIKQKYDLKKAKNYADSFLWRKKIDEFIDAYNSL
jgi:alpha-1,3-mannosyltransferase